ncbi:MAG: hypothetical protein A2X67_00010 [Ignavibacteria bacterium GWA2_55_11]|nr:MAG: hypothetical protein A2X67_00010 [Ignavibacteria bacterium GWA2_55_11]OGU44493.1 MAG: hypothetical protein A2X68_09605 [Ignavibacteria bacterium GWC2_56_12]OGU72608.1 MAG: hypothetical protein A3G43_08235 [Ignavibacteria bacterium RIFCSPLOWO2_12_FULL_56_21]HAV24366.1 sodium:proton exchanger [Bacteroidota bacterium]
MHSELLFAIGLSIIAASLLGYLTQLLRQPIILGYIVAGIVLGPQGLRLISRQEEITLLSELGLAFLLFIVGLEIDLKKFRSSGQPSAIIGVFQVVLCSALGVWVASLLHFPPLSALYLGVTLAFSSTMVVVKLLSDRSELDTLPGRISLGVLLVQDVLAIVALATQGNVNHPSPIPIILSLFQGVGLVGISFAASKFLLPRMFRSVAQNPELMLVLSIAWCFAMCWFALLAGFSIAMGALIAGVSISTYPYSHEVIVKIRSLRDFFVTLFFVSLGMQIVVTSASTIFMGLFLSLFIIVSRIITIFPAALSLKLGGRVGILTSIALAQSSEFSLVIAAIGVTYGHIKPEIVSLIAITLVVTSTLTTYLVRLSHPVARIVVDTMKRLGFNESAMADEGKADQGQEGEIVLLGCHRLGSALVHELVKAGHPLRVFDFNPVVLERLKAMGVPAAYVDISHFDAIEAAGIERASIIVCTVSDEYLRGTSNAGILQFMRARELKAAVVVQANSVEHAVELYAAGADYVMLPSVLTASQMVGVIQEYEKGNLGDIRKKAIGELGARDEVLT